MHMVDAVIINKAKGSILPIDWLIHSNKQNQHPQNNKGNNRLCHCYTLDFLEGEVIVLEWEKLTVVSKMIYYIVRTIW